MIKQMYMYNRLIYGKGKNAYIKFNKKKITIDNLVRKYDEKNMDILRVAGKAYSIDFYAPIIKGLRRE